MKLVLVRANDWEGLYVDGVLHHETHAVPTDTILELVDGKVQWLTPEQDRVLCETGYLPARLEDIETKLKREVLEPF